MSNAHYVDAEFTEGPLDGPAMSAPLARRSDRGAASHALPIYLRDLTLEDLQQQAASNEAHAAPAVRIRQIKEVHHRAAQLMAQGEKDVTIARITQLTTATLRTYRNDPAFKELLAHYTQRLSDAFDSTIEQMGLLASEAVGVMRERLKTDPDAIAAKDLVEVITSMADRTGRGAVTKNINVNVDATSRLREARQRVEQERKGNVKVES